MRDAADVDVKVLVELINAAYKPRDWWLFEQLRTSEEEYRHSTRKAGAHSIVGELDGQPAGHIALWLGPEGAWLGMLATKVDLQGQGIATVLIEEAEARAAAADYKQMRLDCVRENGLQEYYASCGYGVEREERGRFRNATSDWTRVYMVKDLR